MLKAIPKSPHRLMVMQTSCVPDKNGGLFFQERVCEGVYSPYFWPLGIKKDKLLLVFFAFGIYRAFAYLLPKAPKRLLKRAT